MKLSELQPGQGNVDIEATVKSVEEPKTFNKYGKELRLTNAIITDGKTEIKLTLWNDDVDKVKVGSIVKITNGYVNEFQGEKQLTSGKFGKLEIVDGKDSGEKQDKAEETEQKEENKPEENDKPQEKKEENDEEPISEEVIEDY